MWLAMANSMITVSTRMNKTCSSMFTSKKIIVKLKKPKQNTATKNNFWGRYFMPCIF